jgi:hypothetical protein
MLSGLDLLIEEEVSFKKWLALHKISFDDIPTDLGAEYDGPPVWKADTGFCGTSIGSSSSNPLPTPSESPNNGTHTPNTFFPTQHVTNIDHPHPALAVQPAMTHLTASERGTSSSSSISIRQPQSISLDSTATKENQDVDINFEADLFKLRLRRAEFKSDVKAKLSVFDAEESLIIAKARAAKRSLAQDRNAPSQPNGAKRRVMGIQDPNSIGTSTSTYTSMLTPHQQIPLFLNTLSPLLSQPLGSLSLTTLPLDK